MLFADLPVTVSTPAARTPEAVTEAIAAAELVLGDWSGALGIGAEQVAAAPRLAFVQQPSVGTDSLDPDALAAAGVPLSNAAGANATSVAEWCVGAAFAGLRSLAWADARLRAGEWPQLAVSQRGGGELAGRRVGIVGMGDIGRACASRFVALGADVAHWSRRQRLAEEAGGARWLPLDELLAHSQLLVLVVALAPETRGLVDGAALARLPQGAYVVNAARGGVLDEEALLDAVRSGHLAGAALDVYATEPLPAGSPLRDDDRILLSPHAAGASREAQGRLISLVVDNVRRAVSGEPVLHVVNGIDPLIRRRG
ncbi:MAG: D-3-phosphoglycerate dehydrogenase / 2-oxoglutarate reductase [Frankiaceae bacterium]|jgi:D-3-phosphoglycerate dehydrogenase|nr:D-3-phosphoglycerate dehydrogenase / 2-oxoglutarate reductase [Frankiaceae bacterium]